LKYVAHIFAAVEPLLLDSGVFVPDSVGQNAYKQYTISSASTLSQDTLKVYLYMDSSNFNRSYAPFITPDPFLADVTATIYINPDVPADNGICNSSTISCVPNK